MARHNAVIVTVLNWRGLGLLGCVAQIAKWEMRI